MAVTPEDLRRSFESSTESLNIQLVLITTFRNILDEAESKINAQLAPRGLEHKERPVSLPSQPRSFRNWNPVDISNERILLWNNWTFRHSVAPDNSSAPVKIVKVIGSLQFFRDGPSTVETVMAISPQLVTLCGGLKSTKSILSAYCAHLKDRVKKNVINETVPQIQKALQHLRLDEEQSSICNVDIATLFWKHLAGALNNLTCLLLPVFLVLGPRAF